MKKGRVMNCLISVFLMILTLFTSVSMVYAGASVTEYEVIDYIQSLNKNQVEGAQANQKLEGSYSAYRYFVEDLRNELVKSKVAADMVKVSATTADNSCVIGGLAYFSLFQSGRDCRWAV